MRKAKLYISPMDREYLKLYGKLPDYDYEDLRVKYGSKVAQEVRQKRINTVWQNMKAQHKKEQDALLAECPFTTPT